jgi:hypothetical protein
MHALRARALRCGFGVAVGFSHSDQIGSFNDAAFDALDKGRSFWVELQNDVVIAKEWWGGEGHLKTIAACRRKQEQHNITHLLHVDLALPHTNRFHNHVSVTRGLAELNHLVRVLRKPLKKQSWFNETETAYACLPPTFRL